MTVEVGLPVWGSWVTPWLEHAWPTLREETNALGLSLVAYTNEEDHERLRGRVDELRAVPSREARPDMASSADAADRCHADLIDRALATDGIAMPLVAGQLIARGSLKAALAAIDLGYRAVFPLHLPSSVPQEERAAVLGSPQRLAEYAAQQDVFTEWGQLPKGSHPGHLSWLAPRGVLIRSIYLPPMAIRPNRPHAPSRAIDHFMAQGYVNSSDHAVYLGPDIALSVGYRLNDDGVSVEPRTQVAQDGWGLNELISWLKAGNAEEWNVRGHLTKRFWLGERDEKTEAKSDAIIDQVVEQYVRR